MKYNKLFFYFIFLITSLVLTYIVAQERVQHQCDLKNVTDFKILEEQDLEILLEEAIHKTTPPQHGKIFFTAPVSYTFRLSYGNNCITDIELPIHATHLYHKSIRGFDENGIGPLGAGSDEKSRWTAKEAEDTIYTIEKQSNIIKNLKKAEEKSKDKESKIKEFSKTTIVDVTENVNAIKNLDKDGTLIFKWKIHLTPEPDQPARSLTYFYELTLFFKGQDTKVKCNCQ